MPALRRYAYALSRDPGEADDLVQEALLRGHERRRDFRPGGSLRGWLMAILRNLFVDLRRSQAAGRRRDAALALLQSDHADPAQEAALRLARLRLAFLELPADQRQAILLVGVEGRTYAEAAAIAGVPENTLVSRVARGRARLRALEEGEAPALRVVGGRDG